MAKMPIISLPETARQLGESGGRVNVLWQHPDSLVFMARGREYRSEFHINPSDEVMYPVKGDLTLHYRTEEGKEEVVTAADQLIARGREEGQRDMFLELLQARFGALPRAVAARAQAAPEALGFDLTKNRFAPLRMARSNHGQRVRGIPLTARG